MMAGVVLGASLTVGALGVFVWKRTDEANRAIAESAASAIASVNLENQRRLDEADRAFRAAQAQQQEAGPPPTASAPTAPSQEESALAELPAEQTAQQTLRKVTGFSDATNVNLEHIEPTL